MKTVHLMGIGGSGMASLAGMFVEKGWSVRGSDQKIYPPASDELAKMPVKIFEGFKPENLSPAPDLVIVGNVISRGNPEAEALLKSGIPYTSMAQGLTAHFLDGRRSVVVSGTHGKTTTTSLLAWILDSAGLSPGLFVGGIPNNYGRGYRLGAGSPFVIEGDEYDTAFFEKTPKFLHYRPHDVILTSVEFDHADIYRDLPHVIEQFERLVEIVPAGGALIACGDSPTVRDVCAKRKNGPVQFYGTGEQNEWRPVGVRMSRLGKSFDLQRGGKTVAHFDTPLIGDHNVLNAVACAAMASALGVGPAAAAKAVTGFKGVKRRQEFLGEARGVRLYDDFAHHPTAIAETLAGFAPLAAHSKGKLWAVFEPRSNTVRRRVFQKTLPGSFAAADEVILAPVYRKKDALADNEMLRPEEIAEEIRKKGKPARAPAMTEEIIEILAAEAKEGDVIVFMSNGSFDGVPRRTLGRLSSG